MKPYSEACDENRDPILAVIKPLMTDRTSVLEIGSGTGQHAVYFAARLPHLIWYTSDRAENHAGIEIWQREARLKNLCGPLQLDVLSPAWPQLEIDAVFSANTAHIMHWEEVEAMFSGVSSLLSPGGRFLLYGPFNFHGQYTSDSNARFDQWLKNRDPDSGIRNFENLDRLAQLGGMTLKHDYRMPANNRILYWEKQ